MCLMSVMTLWLTFSVGSVGFFASWAFAHRIYGSIKVD